MSETQIIWMILWNHAARNRRAREPFEVAEIAPEVARALNVSEKDARRKAAHFVTELGRLPDGKQYFTIEGNAVVPLPEFLDSPKDLATARKKYPFEL